MKTFFDPAQLTYDAPRFVVNGAWQPNMENAARAQAFLQALEQLGMTPVRPRDSGLEPIEAVHTARYVKFLKTIYHRWARIPDAPAEAIPNIHPVFRSGQAPPGYPASAVGQVGFHLQDGAAPVLETTWAAAYASAQAAVAAADHVADGARSSYALYRPPGHHATGDTAGGFCFLNNAAIAAARLRNTHDRVAVLDVDVHHGNGTQQIFYRRDDVLTASIHADPARFYPFFWGYADQVGLGPGAGHNLNVPLPRGTGDDDYLAALDSAMERIDRARPGAMVLALGLDAHKDDPFKGLAVTTRGFERIARRIARLQLPTAIIQEGGYASDSLSDNLCAFLSAFEAS